MLYYLLYQLHIKATVFNVFRYITFRAVLAILSALIISFILTPYVIRKFHEWKIRSGKREDVPDRHEAKKETPTMGGFVILIATIIPTLLWADLSNYYIWVVIFSLLSFGIIGFMDDVKKLRGINGKGITGTDQALLTVIVRCLHRRYDLLQVRLYNAAYHTFFQEPAPRSRGFLYCPVCLHDRGNVERREPDRRS